MKFTVTYTAKLNIILSHRYIIQIIQVTENADLTKFRHTGKKCELNTTVHCFECPIEWFQSIPKLSLQFFIADSLQHRLIIFIYKNNHTLPRLFTSAFYDTGKT